MTNVVVIGVSGGSASGKTTVANRIKEEFKDSVEILSHDFYYKAYDNLSLEERKKLNYDHPNTFETDRMIADIRKLKQFLPIDRPVYSYTIYNRLPEF